MRRVLLPVVLFALPTSAWAASPNRLSVWAMGDYDGARTEAIGGEDYVATGWSEVALELGSTISNKPAAPARTLGAAGFHVGLVTTFAHLPGRWVNSDYPDGWELMAQDEDPMPLLFVPTVQIRKGLPGSFEVGANFGWIGMSETGVVGAYGRVALVEGYKILPDVSLQAGYSAYVGNDEFELGAMDFSANVGYSLPFGPVAGIHTAKFSPFINLGLTRIHAAPRVDLVGSRLEDRVTELTGFETATTDPDAAQFNATYAPFSFAGGFEVQSGEFTFDLTSGYAVGGAVTFNLGLGFTY